MAQRKTSQAWEENSFHTISLKRPGFNENQEQLLQNNRTRVIQKIPKLTSSDCTSNVEPMFACVTSKYKSLTVDAIQLS